MRRSEPPLWLLFTVLGMSAGTYAMMQSMVVPALTTIQHELDTSQRTVSWVFTGYLLSSAVCTPIVGRLGDGVGRKPMLVASMAVLSGGCVAAALAPNIAVLIVARVAQGVGGGVLPLSFGIIRDEFPDRLVGARVATLVSLTALAVAIGVVVAGPIIDWMGFRWLFWFSAVLTLLGAMGALRYVPDRAPPEGRRLVRLPLVPAALLSGSLVTLLLGVSQAPAWGWVSPITIGLITCSVILGLAWGAAELRAPSPLIDLRIMSRRPVWTNNLVVLLVGFSMHGVFAFMPQFAQTPSNAGYGFGSSATQSGLLIVPSAIAQFIGGAALGTLDRYFGAKRVVVLGCLLSGAALALLAGRSHSQAEFCLLLTGVGLGIGLAFAGNSALIVGAVPREHTAVISGMNNNIRTVGGSLGAAAMTTVVTWHLSELGLPTEAGYERGFLMLAGVLVLGGLTAVLVPSTSPAPRLVAAPVADYTVPTQREDKRPS